jgi:hypothetical protein
MMRRHGPSSSSALSEKLPQSTADIKAHPLLGYKLRVLLYDFRNLRKDPLSELRSLQATDEIYLGLPYFTAEESALIKAAKVAATWVLEPDFKEGSPIPEIGQEVVATATNTSATVQITTVEQAIQSSLQNFFQKRQASGDARPCGPLDLAPIYERVFHVSMAELKDEKFLSRLRRNGLEDGRPTSKAVRGGVSR